MYGVVDVVLRHGNYCDIGAGVKYRFGGAKSYAVIVRRERLRVG